MFVGRRSWEIFSSKSNAESNCNDKDVDCRISQETRQSWQGWSFGKSSEKNNNIKVSFSRVRQYVMFKLKGLPYCRDFLMLYSIIFNLLFVYNIWHSFVKTQHHNITILAITTIYANIFHGFPNISTERQAHIIC